MRSADLTARFIPAFRLLPLAMLLLAARNGFAQQDFGFGGDDAETEETAAFTAAPVVSVGGTAEAALRGFVYDFSKGADAVRLGDVFSGRLNVSAAAAFAEGIVNLKVAPGLVYYDNKSPVYVDEAYVRAWFGNFDIEGGLRKLTWGKADTMGPLDVINPLDYSDLTILVDSLSNAPVRKIARPLVHASWNFGRFSKLEGVFVPGFEPDRFDETGRWMPAQVLGLTEQITGRIVSLTNPLQKQYAADALSRMLPGIIKNAYPETSALDYAQAGLRFTTSIGSADLGAQYYYGRLTTPAFSLEKTSASIVTAAFALISATSSADVDAALGSLRPPDIAYNAYHQLGADWAQVIAGFNLRAEAAINLTGDLAGDDGAVYNPSFAWSFGFDRDLIWGVNLNLQANEAVTLWHSNIDGNPLRDIEAESGVTSTLITAKLSKAFFQDRLEITAAAIWGIEDADCLVMPVITWKQNDIMLELSGGFFAGDREGQFGQYHDNSFVQARMKYTF